MAQYTIDLPCIADTWIDEANPNTNYGSAVTLRGGIQNPTTIDAIILAKFNWAALPANKRILSVIFRFYNTVSLTGQPETFVFVQAAGSAWDESTTWNTAGGLTSLGGTRYLYNQSLAANQYIEIDISAENITNIQSFGLKTKWMYILDGVIQANSYMIIQSRENSNPPILRVTYEDVPPDAPTPTDPIGDYKDNKSIIRFEWQYNSSVGGTQKAFDLQWSTDQSTWTTVSQTTANNYYDMPANTLPSGNIYWRVRCYNEYNEVGPYCDIQSFYAIGAPAAPIINAIPTNSARPVISWSAFNQQLYQLQILQGDTVIYDSGNQPSITARQHKVMAFLADGIYTAKLRIKNEYDLWSAWGEATFTVSTVKPAKPTLTAQPTAYGIELYITGMAYYALIYRSDYGANNYKCIGKTTATTYIDNSVRNKAEYQYYVRSVDEMASDVETYEDSDIQFIQAEIKNSLIAPVSDLTNVFAFTRSLNTPPKRVFDRAPGGAYLQYDGRTYPVWEPSEHISSGLSLAFFLRTWTEAESFIALYDRKETVLYRDAKGRKVYGAMSGLQVTEDRAGYIVSFVINQVDYDEEIEV